MRKTTAETFYSRLLIFSDVLPDESAFDEVLAILSESVWDGTTAQAREQAYRLFDLLGLERPVTSGKEKKKSKEVEGPDESYAALVKEMGY